MCGQMCSLISVWCVCVSAVHGYLFMQVTICECSYECVFRANRFTDMPMHACVGGTIQTQPAYPLDQQHAVF